MKRRFFGAVLLLACTASWANAFVPREALAGSSEGRGTLRILLGDDRAYRVENTGIAQPDGSFALDQTVFFEGEPPRVRHWVIRDASAGRYTFVLSDAAGPGVAQAEGARLELDYPLKRGGLTMHQVLELSADGRTIANDGRICLWGVPIGHLHETIQRVRPRD